MVEELTYKGFVCSEGSGFRLIVKDKEERFRTIPITASNGNFENVNDFAAAVVAVKFFDGTEQISLEDSFDNDFDDIFISVKRSATIQVVAENPIYEIISNSHKDTLKMWEFVDEYFESEEGKKTFKKYSKKDVWK